MIEKNKKLSATRYTLSANFYIFDGAMGTQLMKKGLKSGEVPELWNLTSPNKVLTVHKEYIKAGADVIETNSFGGNLIRLSKYGLQDKLEEININALNIAKKAIGQAKIKIAFSVGPCGDLLAPYGSVSVDDAYASFLRQIEHTEGVDFILCETFMDLNEAKIVLKAAKTKNIPVIVTMTSFRKYRLGYKTIMGNDIKTIVEELAEADVLGANCIDSLEDTLEIAKTFKEHTDKPILIQPNAGKPEIKDNELLYKVSPKEFAQVALKLKELGVEMIGGCCGTTPAHIKTITERIRGKG